MVLYYLFLLFERVLLAIMRRCTCSLGGGGGGGCSRTLKTPNSPPLAKDMRVLRGHVAAV